MTWRSAEDVGSRGAASDTVGPACAECPDDDRAVCGAGVAPVELGGVELVRVELGGGCHFTMTTG